MMLLAARGIDQFVPVRGRPERVQSTDLVDPSPANLALGETDEVLHVAARIDDVPRPRIRNDGHDAGMVEQRLQTPRTFPAAEAECFGHHRVSPAKANSFV